MKRIILFSFFTVLTTLLFAFTNKQDIKINQNFDFVLKTKSLDYKTFEEISSQLKEKGILNNERNADLDENQREEIKKIVQPLIDNGKAFQTELISHVSNSEEWNQLSESEKSSIINMTDEQLVNLSLTLGTTVHTEDLAGAIHDCVGVALGISGIKGLMSTLITAPTVSTAIGILKWVGKRYLSYIGVAWMIWDFADCIAHFV